MYLFANGIDLAGGVGGGSQGQIKFPSTANVSSNANTLDDYEEGTWTPDIRFGGSNSGVTYSLRSAHYRKIGSLVICSYAIVLSNNGSGTGQAQMYGFPFTCTANQAERGGTANGYASGLSGAADVITLLEASSTYAALRYTGTISTPDHSDTTIPTNASFYGIVFYHTDQ